ncbi:SRPBCC family protein [Roseivirga sp.]|uniref:SRPBCC family protein n=1 Tax=Roseivirga sp. TaxID=1964215 RepID=UPI003B8B2717
MNFKADILIEATKEQVWQVISDIEGAKDRISAIQSIEILEQPKDSFIGLKWTETRIMFGKSATETMWITDAKDNDYYLTRAESHGAVYISKLMLEEIEGGTLLTMSFNGTPQTIMAKIMSAVLGPMFKKATIKAIEQDLIDIKASVEK